MGFYARRIFPRICDWVMRDPRMAELRKEFLARVDGEILEIGFGTGLNLPHYPPHVRRIITVDPNPGMNALAQKQVARIGIAVDQRLLGGEALPFEGETFDCVVSTWTLCSISEVGRALDEVYRVLRPAGRFLFLEHGLSADPGVQRWQRRLNPIQRRLAEGCRLDLDVEAVVRGQPFASVSVDRFEMERTPRTHGTMYRGIAVK
jgi:ubiquinone/menaquinone biosynthesis C-methylase UbiE